jgi:hypothetical protein
MEKRFIFEAGTAFLYEGCMRSMQCNVKFEYKLSIWYRTKENLRVYALDKLL